MNDSTDTTASQEATGVDTITATRVDGAEQLRRQADKTRALAARYRATDDLTARALTNTADAMALLAGALDVVDCAEDHLARTRADARTVFAARRQEQGQ